VLRTLAATEPELAADIHEQGIVMTGGGSLLTGVSDALAQATGVPVIIAEDPLTSVAMGAGRALEDEAYSGVMIDS
jgi:rod shape-determining protein MreB